jgi:hypothetical protein
MDLRRSKTIFLLGFLVLVVIWMIAFGGRIAEYNRLSDDYYQAQLTISALTATTVYLSTEVVQAGSEKAVAEWAYEQRKWIREGDQRVAVVPVASTPQAPTPFPTTTPEPQNRFLIWWELFFNTKP